MHVLILLKRHSEEVTLVLSASYPCLHCRRHWAVYKKFTGSISGSQHRLRRQRCYHTHLWRVEPATRDHISSWW